MKKNTFLLLLFTIVFSITIPVKINAQSASVNFSIFRQELSPYGQWITSPRYGEVWVYNDPSFKPYSTNGHWEYTDYGWSWVSDFEWGWAPFHYGRWEEDPYYGWMWIPGYEWAAAWVSWSQYDDYYGWAPLGFGVNINVGFGAIPYNRWTFIPRRNICDRDINRYYISPDRNRNFRNAVVINNYYRGNGNENRFMRGPERNEVERYTNNRITERRIDNRERTSEWAYNDRNRNNRNSVDNNFGRRGNEQPIQQNNNLDRRNTYSPMRDNNNFRNNPQSQREISNTNVRPIPNNNTQNNNRFQPGNTVNYNRQNDSRQNSFPQQRQQQVERPQRQPQQGPQQRSAVRRDGEGQRANNNNNSSQNNNGERRR